MTKILHINSYYSTTGLFKNLYDRQSADQMAIDVYVPISKQFPEQRNAATGHYTTVRRNHQKYDRLIFQLKHNKILKDIKATYNIKSYDLIHAHSLFSNGWLAYQLWKEYGIPYVVAVRSADIRTFFKKMPWLRKTGLNILKEASKIIFISKNSYLEVYNQYIPNTIKEELNQKTKIISNGIDDFWLEHLNHDKSLRVHHPLKIIAVGKLLTEKRFVQLAEMVKMYQGIYGEIELHIVGPAWEEKVATQLSNYSFVTYHGSKKKEELLNLFRQMDIFALLSARETFGLVYPEAMSQGLPVIYAQGEGFDSFFKNGHVGVSVDKRDAIAFMNAINYILNNYEKLSNNAIESAKIFDWNTIHHQYKMIYRELIN